MEEKEKEESELNFMIDNLRLNNQNKEKDTQKLKKVNEELQTIFNDREEQYKSMKKAKIIERRIQRIKKGKKLKKKK